MKNYAAVLSRLFLTAIAIAAVPVNAATPHCSPAQFAKAPQMIQRIYEVSFTTSCVIENASTTKDLIGLKNQILKNLITKLKVNGSPANETYQGLKGVKLSATESSADRHGDTLAIESDFHVATDGYTQLLYSSESSSIKATGDSSHLRKHDLSFRISRKDPGSFDVVFTRLTRVEKPWYAPAVIFKSEVEKNVRQDFAESIDDQIKEIASYF